jgi:hypothetical protein
MTLGAMYGRTTVRPIVDTRNDDCGMCRHAQIVDAWSSPPHPDDRTHRGASVHCIIAAGIIAAGVIAAGVIAAGVIAAGVIAAGIIAAGVIAAGIGCEVVDAKPIYYLLSIHYSLTESLTKSFCHG